jgi:hypothetical protein
MNQPDALGRRRAGRAVAALELNIVNGIMKRIGCVLAVVVLLPGIAPARIKLVALPERARLVVALNNPDATLVEEERVLTLQKGMNHVDFAWSGVNIDAGSIQLRLLSHPDQIGFKSITTSYPPNENALVWEFPSPQAFEERVRISYILSGLTREVVYKAVAEPNEKALRLRNYLRLRNQSGEDLTEAELTLGYGADFKKNVAHEEVLEMLSERIEALPIKKTLNWDAAAQPWQPEYEKKTVGLPLYYIIKNDQASKLGTHTLLPGKARIFIKTREVREGNESGTGEGVAFTGEDWAALTPVGRELKLYIGQSRDVKVTQLKVRDDRANMRRNNDNQVVFWDTDELYKVEIENFKKQPVNLTLLEHLRGYWKMVENSHPKQFKKKDAFSFEYNLVLPPESNGTNKTTVTFNLNRLNVQDNDPASF